MTKQAPKSESPKRDLWQGIVRRQRLFWLSAALFALAGLGVALQIQPKFHAEATFDYPLFDVAGQTISDRSIVSKIKSIQAVEKVADKYVKLGEISGLPAEQQALHSEQISEITGAITINRQSRTISKQTIAVGITHTDEDVAWNVPVALIHNFIDESFDQQQTDLKESKRRLEQEIARIKKQLAELDKQEKFQKIKALEVPEPKPEPKPATKPAAPKLDPEQQAEYENLKIKAQAIEAQRQIILQQTAALKAKIARLKKDAEFTRTGRPSQIIYGVNPEKQRLHRELIKVERQLTRAIQIDKMTANHPYVKALQSTLKTLHTQHDAQPDKIIIQEVVIPDSNTEAIDRQAAQLRKELVDLQTQLAQNASQAKLHKAKLDAYAKLLKALPAPIVKPVEIPVPQVNPAIAALAKIAAEKASLNKRLVKLNADLKAANQSLEQINLSREDFRKTVTPPLGLKPAGPGMPKIIGMVVGGSLLFALGIVLIVTASDKTVTSAAQARKITGLITLGNIGEISTRKQRSRQIASWVITPIIGTALVIVLGMMTLRLQSQLSTLAYDYDSHEVYEPAEATDPAAPQNPDEAHLSNRKLYTQEPGCISDTSN